MCPSIARMPNGAYHGGIDVSVNAPARRTRRQCASYTSTRALWKSVAYTRSPSIATPRKTAASAASSTTTSACVDHPPGTVGVQARSIPSSHA